MAAKVAEADEPLSDTLVFGKAAGVVPVRQLMEGTTVVGDELIAPEQLSLRSEVATESITACPSFDAKDIQVDVHRPVITSVGLPFLIVELYSRDAPCRCVPSLVAYKTTLPLDGAVSIYAYTRDVGNNGVQAGHDLQSRTFIPHMTGDPATGSATCTTVALPVTTRSVPELALRAR